MLRTKFRTYGRTAVAGALGAMVGLLWIGAGVLAAKPARSPAPPAIDERVAELERALLETAERVAVLEGELARHELATAERFQVVEEEVERQALQTVERFQLVEEEVERVSRALEEGRTGTP